MLSEGFIVIELTLLQQDKWHNYWCVDEHGGQWYFKASNGIRALYEWLASEIGKRMELPVPEVSPARIGDKLGVAIKDVGMGINVESPEFISWLREMSVDWTLISNVAVFDILICNMDRDATNWFLIRSKQEISFVLLDHDDAFLGRDVYLNARERDRQAQIFRCYSKYPMQLREMADRWDESPLLSMATNTDWEGVLSERCVNFIQLYPRMFPALVRRIFQLMRLRQIRMKNNTFGDGLGRMPRSCFDVPIKSPLMHWLW